MFSARLWHRLAQPIPFHSFSLIATNCLGGGGGGGGGGGALGTPTCLLPRETRSLQLEGTTTGVTEGDGNGVIASKREVSFDNVSLVEVMYPVLMACQVELWQVIRVSLVVATVPVVRVGVGGGGGGSVSS